jgi:hypothetical protein
MAEFATHLITIMLMPKMMLSSHQIQLGSLSTDVILR